jgi:aminoglycoside phosphotransferase (APT) family kinase protein
VSLKNWGKTFEPYLAGVLEAKGEVEIRREKRLAMGQSRAMYILDLAYTGPQGPTERRIIARIEQWGHLGADSRNEVSTMRALRAVGFPVANVIAYETSHEILGQPFFLMDFVQGSSVFRPETADDYIRLLHRLHQIDWDSKHFEHLERPASMNAPAWNVVEHLYDVYRTHLLGEPSPLIEECVQWLRNHAPETEQITLVHGDPGPGNYLTQDGKITILVDWEFTALGDPYEDWAYLVWMRGAPFLPEDDWLARIERVLGKKLDRQRMKWWKATNILKGVCVDTTSLKLYADKVNPAANLLAIGTCWHLDVLRRLCAEIFNRPTATG